jgi:hemolysin III
MPAPLSALPPSPSPDAKPRLRGVSHEFAFYAALAATFSLVVGARSRAAAAAGLLFGASLALLFGTSALYHRVQWEPAARQRVRRLDHAAIFVLIAGGYTPLFALVPGTNGGHTALWAIWLGASVGVLKSIFFVHAPKWVTALVCVGLGWTAAGEAIDRAPAVGPLCIGLLVASGAIYSIGALVYALKRPDPFPKVFGYHEVFHAMVIVASGCLFAHVKLVLGRV